MSQQPVPHNRDTFAERLLRQGQYAELDITLPVRLRFLPADGHQGSSRVTVEVCYPPDGEPSLVENTLLLRFYTTPDRALDAFMLTGREPFRYLPLDSNRLYAVPEDQPWLSKVLHGYNCYTDDIPEEPEEYPVPFLEDMYGESTDEGQDYDEYDYEQARRDEEINYNWERLGKHETIKHDDEQFDNYESYEFSWDEPDDDELYEIYDNYEPDDDE